MKNKIIHPNRYRIFFEIKKIFNSKTKNQIAESVFLDNIKELCYCVYWEVIEKKITINIKKDQNPQ